MIEIITANGQQYEIETPLPLTMEQRNEVIRQLGGNPEVKKAGCSSCGQKSLSDIVSLNPATCVAKVPAGSTKSIICSAPTGQSPFQFTVSIDGVAQTPSVYTTTPWTFNWNVPAGVSKTYTIGLTVKDSCPGTTAVSSPDTCTTAAEVRALASMTRPTCSSYSINVGQTSQATVGSGTDQFGDPFTPTGVTWTAAPPSLATISSSGLLTGVGSGSVTAIATSNGISQPSLAITIGCPSPTCSFTML